jgi:hypothetical protein
LTHLMRKPTLKPGFRVIGARVETTMGTRRLSAVELGGVNVLGLCRLNQVDP